MAADAHNLTAAAVSKRLIALENRLSAKLFFIEQHGPLVRHLRVRSYITMRKDFKHK
ncbi:helix-turn-helix domain-containing protein (plasmid) [Pseudoalteromonas espejiana]